MKKNFIGFLATLAVLGLLASPAMAAQSQKDWWKQQEKIRKQQEKTQKAYQAKQWEKAVRDYQKEAAKSARLAGYLAENSNDKDTRLACKAAVKMYNKTNYYQSYDNRANHITSEIMKNPLNGYANLGMRGSRFAMSRLENPFSYDFSNGKYAETQGEGKKLSCF